MTSDIAPTSCTGAAIQTKSLLNHGAAARMGDARSDAGVSVRAASPLGRRSLRSRSVSLWEKNANASRRESGLTLPEVRKGGRPSLRLLFAALDSPPTRTHGKSRDRTFDAGDQFAAEIIYFSDCLLNRKDPEPSGEEGLADLRIIRAIYHSAQTGKPVQLGEFQRQHRPTLEQVIQRPASEQPELIHAADPSGNS